MNPTLELALATAKKLVEDVTKKDTHTARLAELTQMSHTQLLQHVVELEGLTKPTKYKAEELYFTILTTPECVWLSYTDIADLINSLIPTAAVTAHNLQWHAHYLRRKKGLTVLKRAPKADRDKLLMKTT